MEMRSRRKDNSSVSPVRTPAKNHDEDLLTARPAKLNSRPLTRVGQVRPASPTQSVISGRSIINVNLGQEEEGEGEEKWKLHKGYTSKRRRRNKIANT